MLDEWDIRYSEIARKALNIIFDEVEELLDIENDFSVVEKITGEMCRERKKWVETGYRNKTISVKHRKEEEIKEIKNDDQIIEEWEIDMLDMSWERFIEDFDVGGDDHFWYEKFPTEIDYEIYKKTLINRISKFQEVFQEVYNYGYGDIDINIKIPITKQEKMFKDRHFISITPKKESIGIGIIGENAVNDKVTESQKKDMRKASEDRGGTRRTG